MAAPILRVPEEERSRACTLDAEPGRPTPVSVQACALAMAMHSAVVQACALVLAMHSAVVQACALVLAAVQETVLVRACGLAWVAALFREQVAAKAPRQHAVAMRAAQPEGHEPMVQ